METNSQYMEVRPRGTGKGITVLWSVTLMGDWVDTFSGWVGYLKEVVLTRFMMGGTVPVLL
jgi:hypothetical protein